jgi:hypothetical protein
MLVKGRGGEVVWAKEAGDQMSVKGRGDTRLSRPYHNLGEVVWAKEAGDQMSVKGRGDTRLSRPYHNLGEVV